MIISKHKIFYTIFSQFGGYMKSYNDDNRFFDLGYDVYFKAFFLNNKMLAGFLSLLWNTKVNPEDITYDNTESVIPEGKKIIYDVVANVTLHEKEEINVNLEMQNLYHKYLNDRMAYYAMRKYSEKLEKAGQFGNGWVESIWFLGFDESKFHDNNNEKWLSEYRLINEDGNILTDKFRINQIFLKNKDKCPIIELQEFFKLCTSLDRDNLPEFSTDREEAKEMLLKMNNDKVLRAESFSHEMFLMDQKAQFKSAREEGLEEGLTKGKAEGIEERNIAIAKKLFESGQTKEFISSITGLSLDVLNNILK